MAKEIKDDFQLDSEEEREIAHFNMIEKEKYKARKYNEMQMRKEAEILNKHKEENEGIKKEPIEEKEVQVINEQFVLTRNILAKGVFRANFNIVKNCYVKIRVNEDYRICKILGIQETDSYVLNPAKKSKEKIYCRIGLNLDAGRRSISGWPIANISDRPVTAEEIRKFVENYRPTHKEMQNLIKTYETVCMEFSRNMTNSEITEFISRKNKANPQKLSNTEIKMNLIKKRDEAITRKDKKEAAEAQRELEKIEDEEFADRMKTFYTKEDLEKSMAKRKEASATFSKNKLNLTGDKNKVVKKNEEKISELKEEDLIGFLSKKEEENK